MKTKTNLELLCKSTITDDNDKLVITGLASSTSEDLDGDRVSLNALTQMYSQVKGLSLFMEHEHHLKSILGVITDAELKGEALYITAEILPEHKSFVKGLLDSGVNLGFSIGGIATFDSTDKSLMADFNLLEVSLVSLPANWESYSTVVEEKSVTCKCLLSGLHELKHLGDDTIVEQNTQNIEPTAEEVIKSEAIPEETPIEEAVEKAEEIAEETVPEMEEKSEDIESEEDITEKAVEEEEAEKACEPEAEEKPKFLTADDIGSILESFMAEKEEQMKADILAALQTMMDKKSMEEPAEEEEEKSEEVETEKSVEMEAEEPVAEEAPVSKYASYEQEQATETKSFLGSGDRDFLGRNINYL